MSKITYTTLQSEEDARQAYELTKIKDINYYLGSGITPPVLMESAKKNGLYLAKDGEKVVGFIQFNHRKKDDVNVIYHICVHPDYRGQHIALTLSNMVPPPREEKCRPDNVKIQALYRKIGMELAEKQIYYTKKGTKVEVLLFKQGYMKDSAIIVSGGMDSITLLHDKKENIALAITFDYGSNHAQKEIAFAKLHCERLGIKHIIIPLQFIKDYFKSSLLQGADAIPEGHYQDENMKSTVVPFRNGIMLSIACGIAESNGLKKVLIANHAGDHAIYPDCREEFVNAMSHAMSAGTYENVCIDAPYTNITKGDIAKRGKELGIDYAETWSCYKGGAKHCGKCGTCVERKEALREAGIMDFTEYED